MAGRDGGRGVVRSAIEYTLRNGKAMGPKVDPQRRWSYVFEPDQAIVAVNSANEIITTVAKSRQYWNK